MASISQGLVLTTAMVVSSTVLYLGFLRQKTFPLLQIPGNSSSQEPNKKVLRSCLCSEEKKRERNQKMKKKRVQFADNVKEKGETRKAIRGKQRKQNRVLSSSSCRNETPEIRRMPENRIALYNGILRDRVHRLEYSC